MHDLTTSQGVAVYMEGATSWPDWDLRRDEVVAANDRFPEFWHATINESGLAARVGARLNGRAVPTS